MIHTVAVQGFRIHSKGAYESTTRTGHECRVGELHSVPRKSIPTPAHSLA